MIGLLFFARPTTSDFEKRELTPFPTFTVEGFLDGSFFSDVSLWYADTYPLREPLVKMDRAVDSLFGIQAEEQMIGGNVPWDQVSPERAASVESLRARVREALELENEAAWHDAVMNAAVTGQ